VSRLARSVLAVSAAWLAPAQVAPAQDAPAQPAAEPEAAVETATVDSAFSDALAVAAHRTALIDLRLLESPTALDYRATHDFMSLIAEVAPGDLAVARHAAAAAFGTGDADLLEQATRRVIRLDPDDTVSQLRLIVSRIAENQTVEDRLAAYDRFLGRAGERIDPTIRSRLALDAALLHRERGESQKFVERLTLATELDSTNKDAAALAFNYYASRVPGDAVGQLRLQFNLLFADPFDPRVHMSIALLLAQEGAMIECFRFHRLGLALLDAVDARGPQRDVERLTLMWELQGPEAVVAEIARRLASERDAARAVYERDLKLDVADEDLLPPEEVSLDGLYERMRVLAGLAAGDFVAVETGIEELKKISDRATAALRDPTRSLDPAEEAELLNDAIRAVSDLQFMRAVANVDIEKFDAETTAVARLGPRLQAALAPLAAWIRYRNGDPAAALELAEQIDRDVGENFGTSILRGLANESLGSIDAALFAYRDLIKDDPLGPVGAWARSRMNQILGRDDPRTPAGQRMGALVNQVPLVIDRMIGEPILFLEFTLDGPEVVKPGEPVELELQIRNVSSIPLALGPDRPLNSRVVLLPLLDQRDVHTGRGQPEVIELDRRLRLDPLESLTVRVRPEGAFNGLINIANDPLLRNQRWRAVQGFTLSTNGQYEPGALCGSDDTGSILLEANPLAQLAPADLAAEIDRVTTEGDRRGLMLAARAAAAAFMRATPSSRQPPVARGSTDSGINPREADDYEPIPGSSTSEDLAPVVDALVRAHDAADPLARTLILATVPPASVTPGVEALDAAALEAVGRPTGASDPAAALARAIALVTRVADPEHPALAAALASAEPRLRLIAAAVSRRLQTGLPTAATTGPGFNELAGPTRRAMIERARARLGR